MLPLFQMMEKKLFGPSHSSSLQEEEKIQDDKAFFRNVGGNEKDYNIMINMCTKICKIIMRKLSVTHDTEFRGRV